MKKSPMIASLGYIIFCVHFANAATLPTWLTVPPTQGDMHVAAPLATCVRSDTADQWRLVEADHPEIVLPAQHIPAPAADGAFVATGGCLAATIPGCGEAAVTRHFRLESDDLDQPSVAPAFAFREINDNSLGLFERGKPVLVYNHGVITNDRVPEDDPRRRRASYIHPLHGLDGEVLTDDFPRDHYHHHGIFWTWPHVEIAGREYNVWTGADIENRFVRWIARHTGPVAAVLAVENGWFVGEKKVMIERVWLRVYRATDHARALDLDLTWIPVDHPISLRGAVGKSYGGMTMRFHVPPGDACAITVPDGATKEDLPDTRLAWADLARRFNGAATPSGAALMVPPAHPDFPPTWLTRHYGILCVGYPGVTSKTFPAGEPLRLSYRVWIHKDADLAALRKAYAAYVEGAKAAWR